VAFRKAERSRWHTNASSGFPSMAPTNKIRARLVAGKGGLLDPQLAANRIFRQNMTTEDAPLPRHIVTIEDVTAGLGLDSADEQAVQRLIVDTNAHFDQTQQTQRIALARERFVTVLRAMPYISSDIRMELTKRVIAYWRRTTQTDYGKVPTIRSIAVKSEPTLVIKAQRLNGDEKRIEMPQIVAKKLPAFLKELRKDGAKCKRKSYDADKLQPMQNKLDTAKVERLKNTPEALKKPIVVSHDGFILDGHHRWAACKALDQKVPCIEVALDKDELLEQARDFDGAEFRKADKIPGGLADKKKPSDFDKAKLAAGIKVEMEHTSDRAIATEIAMDHLTEDAAYYEKLATIEKAEQLGLDFTRDSTPKEGPPAGYSAVPNSKRGGYRKRHAGSWQYWYPDSAKPKRTGRKKKAKKRVNVWGPLSHEAVAQWRKDFRQATKLQKQIMDEAETIFRPQWDAHNAIEPSKRPFAFEPEVPEEFAEKFYEAKNVVENMGMQLRGWATSHVLGLEGRALLTKPEDIPEIGRRDIATKLSGMHFTGGFPEAMQHKESVTYAPGIEMAEYAATAWKQTQRRVRGLLNAVDTFIADTHAGQTSRTPISTFNKQGIQFAVHGEGFEGTAAGDDEIANVVETALRVKTKLDKMGLGKTLAGLRVHVHNETRRSVEGHEHRGRENFTTAGYYNVQQDYVRLFNSGNTQRVVTHELGHRVYYQLMGSKARAEWANFYESRREKVTDDDVEELADLLEMNSEGRPKADVLYTLKALEAKGTPEAKRQKFLLQQLKLGSDKLDKWGNVPHYGQTAEQMGESFRQAVKAGTVNASIPDEFVTQYAETDDGELFAEAFDHYVRNGPSSLKPRVRDQLERALRSTGMKLQKSEDNEPILVTSLSKGEQAARGGKYIKRVPYYVNGKRKYRYYYRESAAARDVTVGETVKLGERVAEVLGIDKDGKITIREGKRKRTVTADQWSKLMAKHYGDRYFEWAEKRASQTVNAVLRHVPREMLTDLKGTDAERMAQLEKRVPEVYAKLRASFQRSGVSPFEAKRVLGTVLERKGWEPEARAAVIGNVIEHRNMAYRQTIQGAENLAGGGKVKAGHVQAMADILDPPGGKTLKAEVDDLAGKAETELATLSSALAKARDGNPKEALEAALNSPAMARLALVAQAMPGLKDKAIQPTRDAMAQVQAVIPRSQPTREGASAVVYVAGENGAPRALKARYKLVEASEAVASHDPNSFKQREGYPEGVQERAYHRDRAEQAKVMRNANKLNPAFLVNTNPDAVNGPPILDQNGVVLGGNSRTMSMQLAYEKHPDRAKELRAYMEAHAHETGFTPEDVKALKNPVLVRVVESTGPDDQKLLVRQMNESFTQGMDPRTMQVAMGRKLDDAAVKQLGDSMEADETLNAFLDSPRAEGFINALTRVGVIDQRNSNQYMVKGTKRLNEDGKQLVERVLVGRTVGDADLLSNTTAKIVGNIARSVPFMAQAKAHGATYDLGDDLKVALEQFNDLSFRARQGHRAALNADMSDKEFKGLFAQAEMFGERNPILDNPRAMTLLEVLIRKNGPQKMSAVFRDYAALAAQHPEDQDSMFGDKPSPEALLERAMKGEAKKSMEPTLVVKSEPTLIVKARSILTPNIQVGEARGAPRFDTPPMPDYQGIYYPPEDSDAHKRERDQAMNRRQADAKRARGKWGFHGKVLSAKPAIKWEMDRTESDPAFKQPQDRETGKPLRVSPKLNARTREEKGKTTYQDTELVGEDKPKSKRKKKKKRVRLTARKR